MSGSTALRAARLALSTALVTAATAALSIYVPATRGYFNLGETMVYFTALLLGPAVGAFAGGVGSALADIILGYTIYAPATLVIKAAEGAAAGFLARWLMGRERAGILAALSLLVAAGYLLLVLVLGLTLFTGEVEVSLAAVAAVSGSIPPLVWFPAAVAAAATPLYLSVRSKRAEGLLVLVLLVSGLIMVSGYYIYEQFILGYYALAEVPVNLGQVVLGAAVAIPLYRGVQRILSK